MTYQAFATVYDQLMADVSYEDWVRFTYAFWDHHDVAPKTLVDLGCGTGNLTIPMVHRGLDVTGIDMSEEMLAVAEGKRELWEHGVQRGELSRRGSIRFIQQDMREWELGVEVDGVISYCDCLNYLTEEADLVAAFQCTMDGLVKGGWFLFDMHSPFTLKQYGARQPFVQQDDDISYLWTCEWQEARMEVFHDLSIFVQADDGRYDRIDEQHVQRAYAQETVEAALRQVGFTEIQCFADFRLHAPGPRSRRWFFAARKPN